MSYIVKGYVGTKEEIILKTNKIGDAVTEYLSFEEDLRLNPHDVEDRYDYIELIKEGVVLESERKYEYCDRCGHHDILDCTSNGCVYEY
jgi:hypothetical protein